MIRYASFGRRTWALVLDALLDLFVFAALIRVVGGGAEAVAPLVCWYLIHHVGLVTEGGTLGHRLAGLRIVAVDGRRVRVSKAFVRELARLFVSLPPLGLGFLWMLDEPHRRTWHDLLGGTVVVREAAELGAATPTWADAPPWRRSVHPVRSDALAD